MSAASATARASDAAAARPSVLEANGLSFSYGERQALRDVSFTIGRGEIFGFLGPNGGGKTTLFKILSTLVESDRGEVRMLGHDLRAQAKPPPLPPSIRSPSAAWRNPSASRR